MRTRPIINSAYTTKQRRPAIPLLFCVDKACCVPFATAVPLASDWRWWQYTVRRTGMHQGYGFQRPRHLPAQSCLRKHSSSSDRVCDARETAQAYTCSGGRHQHCFTVIASNYR